MKKNQTKAKLIQEMDALRQRLADLDSTHQRYVNLFEHASDAILIIDPTTFIIMDTNRSAAQRLGYDRDELPGLKLDEIEVLSHERLDGR